MLLGANIRALHLCEFVYECLCALICILVHVHVQCDIHVHMYTSSWSHRCMSTHSIHTCIHLCAYATSILNSDLITKQLLVYIVACRSEYVLNYVQAV